MRILSVLIACAVMIVILAIPAYAHPGKTDSNGGHYDHSTGEYHYHHGYSAHSHYDVDGDGIVDCPYDFDDQTDHSSSSNSSSSSSSSYRYTYPDTPVYATIPFEKSNDNLSNTNGSETIPAKNIEDRNFFIEILGAFFILVCGLLALCGIGFVIAIYVVPLGALVMYPLACLVIEKGTDKRESFALTCSVVVIFALALYWIVPMLTDFILESAANMIVVVFFVLIIIAVLVYINYSSSKENTQLVRKKDEFINELRKKNIQNEEIIKGLNDQYAGLKKKYDKELEQKNSQQKLCDSRFEIAYKEINRYQRENQQVKRERTELLKKNEVLQQEIGELKQKLHFYESGHTVSKPQIDNLPSDVYFVDGLPIAGKVTEHEPFGRFTVYASKKGTRFHSDDICGGNWLHPIHLFEAIENKQRCMKCGGLLPSSLPDWYIAYKHRK